jgi:hypothetical protein
MDMDYILRFETALSSGMALLLARQSERHEIVGAMLDSRHEVLFGSRAIL